MSSIASQQVVPVPEPNLTPGEMIERAARLKSRLRAEQDETERRSVHSEAIHEEFRKAGFYRCLQPRRFGGYEFEIKTYLEIGMEISRGDPSVGWCLMVGAGHALMLGSYFGEQAQASGFGPTGDFSAPSVAAPTGTATREGNGWFIKGKWGYASGAPYSTHFMPSLAIVEKEKDGSERRSPGIALVPRSEWQMLDDWGSILGMRGSGSNSILIEGAHVPASHVIHLDMLNIDLSKSTPGYRLHSNPMYAGRCLSFFHGELVAVMVGLGYAMLDEYEHLIRTKGTPHAPSVPRSMHHDYQRNLGLAIGLLHAAKLIVLGSADAYMDLCRRGAEGGEPFTMEEDLELFATLEHGGRIVWEAVDLMVRTASSSAVRDGERMQRYYRDASIYRSHLSAQYEMLAQRLGAAHLGIEHDMNTDARIAKPPQSPK